MAHCMRRCLSWYMMLAVPSPLQSLHLLHTRCRQRSKPGRRVTLQRGVAAAELDALTAVQRLEPMGGLSSQNNTGATARGRGRATLVAFVQMNPYPDFPNRKQVSSPRTFLQQNKAGHVSMSVHLLRVVQHRQPLHSTGVIWKILISSTARDTPGVV